MRIGAGRLVTSARASESPVMEVSDLTAPLVQRLAAYLLKASGILVDTSKSYLVESKLKPIITSRRLSGFVELVAALENGSKPELASAVVQAMTINETHFFRDRVPFQALHAIVPDLLQANRYSQSLRIWSAACSTGQEIYSIAMVLQEMAVKLAGFKVDLVATDISSAVLDKAASGIFCRFEVERGLPPDVLGKNFSVRGEDWIIDERIKRQVRFQRQNLLEDFSSLGRFDLVFCRNVLIYFNDETRRSILKRIGRQLNPGGLLALGSAESMVGLSAGYVLDHRSPAFMRPSDAVRAHQA